MITTHQYLSKYPIQSESEILILGTIHPHFHEQFTLPFFYGNELSLWRILASGFPGQLNPTELESILRFLSIRQISISDTIVSCRRKNPTALDEDLEPIELNHSILESIKESKIRQIFFTSGFEKNNAFKLFYVDILNQKITKEIRANRYVDLTPDFFGRPIRLTILYSPARTANRGLARSKSYLAVKDKYKDSKQPVSDFKIDYYRQHFR